MVVRRDSHRPVIPRRAYYPVLATGLATNVYADFMQVVVPLWAVMLGAGPAEIGIMIGARSLLPTLLSIHGGVLMDRFGTRRLMMLCTAAMAVLIPFYPFAPWFPALVALQMITGLLANFSWIGSQTLIARLGKGDAHYLGVFSFISRVGSFGAPVAIGLAWDLGGHVAGFAACTLVALGLFAAVAAVPPWAERGTPGQSSAEPVPASRGAPRLRWRDLLPRISDYVGSLALLAIPAVALGIAVALLRHTPSTIQSSFYITYLKETGFTATAIGALIACCEVPSAFGSLLAAPLMRRLAVHWLLIGLTAVTIALMAVTPLLGGLFLALAAAQVGRGAGHGLLHPMAFSVIAKALPPGAQAQGVALRTTGNRLGAVLLPVVMGAVASVVGVENAFLAMGALLLAPVAVMAVLVARSPAFRLPR